MVVMGLLLIVLSIVASAAVVVRGRTDVQVSLRSREIARERFLTGRYLDTVTRQTVEQMLQAVQYAQLRVPVDFRDERAGRERGDRTGRR